MRVTQEELGRRLRASRESCGLTQQDAARHLGVSRSTVAQMEIGRRKVSGLELFKLARLYGRAVSDFLADGFERDGVGALLRALPEARESQETHEAVRRVVAIAREITALQDVLDLSQLQLGLPHYRLSPPRRSWDAVEQGKDLAMKERNRLGLGNAPADSLALMLEREGLMVLGVELPSHVSGFTLRFDSFMACGVNVVHPETRQRFSLAHEYCHAICDIDTTPGIVSRQGVEQDLREKRANVFAAEFLMPARGVRDFLARFGKGLPSRGSQAIFTEGCDRVSESKRRTTPRSREVDLWHIALVAEHFGVSRESAIWRLVNLGVVDERKRDDLLAQERSGNGRRISSLIRGTADVGEKSRVLHLATRRLLTLAREALSREEISTAKFREIGRLAGLENDEIDEVVLRLRGEDG